MSVYIIHATDRGYWNPNRKGYTLNPSSAGVYVESEASRICIDSSRKDKMYKLNQSWHKAKIKKYRESKMRLIQSAMEGLTGNDLIDMLPEIIKERIKRNGLGND